MQIMNKIPYEEQVIKVIRETMPSVVSIVVGKDYEKILKENPYDLMVPHGDHVDPPPPEEALPHTKSGKIKVGGGSGFIVDASGLIVTNKHVISDPEAEDWITTLAEDIYPAKILARDPLNDVAILKIEDPRDLDPLPLGDSNKIQLGETVIAIGTALGEFQNTVSKGIISGLSRFVSAITDTEGHSERLRGLIQTDAAINPGNSGGPLVNLYGEAIGINTAVVFGAQNISFAIPIHRAKRDIHELNTYGHIRRPFLGIRYIPVNPLVKKRFSLSVDNGAMILKEGLPDRPAVVPNSVAAKAGIRETDVILALNNTQINEKTSIEDVLETVPMGSTIEMTILRNGEQKTIALTAEERAP